MLYPTNHSSFPQGIEGYPSNKGFNKSSPKLFYLFIIGREIQAWVSLGGDVLPLRISLGITCRWFYSQSRRPGLDPELKSSSTSGPSSEFPSTQQMMQTGSEVFLWLHSKVNSDHGTRGIPAVLPPGNISFTLLSFFKILMYWQNWIHSHPKHKYGSIQPWPPLNLGTALHKPSPTPYLNFS